MPKTKAMQKTAANKLDKIAEQTSLIPTTLEEATNLAKLISESDLAPKDFKGKPGNTLIAIQMGAEIGISPMRAIQNIAVINGRPSLFGDIGKALLLARGCKIEERDIKEVQKVGEAWCKITRPDGNTTERTFSLENAKTAQLWGKAGPWTQYPYRQMAWRAFWFAARDGASDFLSGFAGTEEMRDFVETTAVRTEAAEEAARVAIPAPKDVDENDVKPEPETGWSSGVTKFIAKCATCGDEISVGSVAWYDSVGKRSHHAEHFTVQP